MSKGSPSFACACLAFDLNSLTSDRTKSVSFYVQINGMSTRVRVVRGAILSLKFGMTIRKKLKEPTIDRTCLREDTFTVNS